MNPLADQIIDLYDRHAVQWDKDRNQRGWIEKPWFERFGGLLPNRASILDLGCGSGSPIARYLAENDFNVTGVDASRTLISICRSRLPQQEWIVADMRGLSLGRHFHGVLAWDGFFHLAHPHQRQMFSVFRNHAAPGAILMFNSGTSHGESIGTYQGEPLYHATLDSVEYRSLLTQNGFEALEHVVEDANAGGRTVWLARKPQ
jgi:2-polyprenyl-3-methyl-5-hydroxy-6-metoxy-1,4-benzoquinol methylase